MQTDLFTPTISDERLDQMIVEAHRKSGHYIAEKGTEVGGWSRDRYKHVHIKIGMEMVPVTALRRTFRAFLETM